MRKNPNIGHNSVQVPHNGRYTPYHALTSKKQEEVDADLWNHYEARKRSCRPLASASGERQRLIKLGHIIPERFAKPQMLVKIDGKWSLKL